MHNSKLWPVAFLALIGVPVFISVDFALARRRGWFVQSRLDALILLAAMSCCLAITVATVFRPVRQWLSFNCFRLLFSVVFAAGIWLGAEAVVGIRFRPPSDFHLQRPNLQFVFRPVPEVMNGIEGESRFTINSRGVRGPEFPVDRSAFRILCVGGSATACTYQDDLETWPRLLMIRLNAEAGPQPVWVGDVGQSGFTTREHLRFVRESPLMLEMDCIVALVGVNDLHAFLQGDVGADWPMGPHWSRSPVLGQVRRVAHQVPTVMIEDEAGSAYEARRVRRRHATVSTIRPDPSTFLSEYRSRIERIIAHCSERGVRLVLVTQPVLWASDMPKELESRLWMGWQPDGTFLAASTLRGLMDQVNATLRQVGAALAVPVVDLSDLSGDPELFYDDCHFTEAGSRVVAERISTWFSGQGNPPQVPK